MLVGGAVDFGQIGEKSRRADSREGWFAVECGLVLTDGGVIELFWLEKFFLLC